MHFRLLSCEVLHREMCTAAARSQHLVDIEFLPKGFGDQACEHNVKCLQEMIDGTSTTVYDAVLLGYGQCGSGLTGLTAREIPVVIPRAYDCITLYLGHRERHREYSNRHPGAYFRTTGWVERGEKSGELRQISIDPPVKEVSYAEMVARYGEENARFLSQEQHKYPIKYRQLTFIEMGLESDDRFERCSLEEAARRGWKYEKIRGDMSLIQGLLDGDWDPQRYLVVEPGRRIISRCDDQLFDTEESK